MFELIAEVLRGKNENGKLTEPQVESRHYGIIAVVDEAGNVLFSRGQIAMKTYIRSAAKPFQILPLLASGTAEHFEFTSKELAVICGSHNGESEHVLAAASILKKIGLNESHLQCGTHPPYHVPSSDQILREGGMFAPLHNNCSGKHAGMLACCVFRKWPVENYLDFQHPLQLEIKNYVELYSGASDVFRGTDGCSAPVFYLEIQQMARMFAHLAAQKDPLLTRSFEIVRKEPFMIGGTRRFDSDLMASSNVVAKVGGEGIECIAVPASADQKAFGIAVKIADGNFRALYPVVISLLKRFEVLSEDQLQRLQYYDRTPLKNHIGKEIGWIQSVL